MVETQDCQNLYSIRILLRMNHISIGVMETLGAPSDSFLLGPYQVKMKEARILASFKRKENFEGRCCSRKFTNTFRKRPIRIESQAFQSKISCALELRMITKID